TLQRKPQAQIFLFDESDNGLDREKQVEFQAWLKELVAKKKVVVCVRDRSGVLSETKIRQQEGKKIFIA
ncbi:MAG: hypothetical protein MRERV_45c001, partial [Mycoplasmataceae bacterium RV_VA103A]